MKILLFWAFIMIACPIYAEDWTTTDGKTYQGVKVLKVEADAVTILDSDGGALVPLSSLPANLQKRFNYDPSKAVAAKMARDAQDKANAHALQTEMNQADSLKNQSLIAEQARVRASEFRQEASKNALMLKGYILQKCEGGYLVVVEVPNYSIVASSSASVGGGGGVYSPPVPAIDQNRPARVKAGTYFFVSSKSFVDNDPVDVDVWENGQYSYVGTDGARRTVRSLTDNLDIAVSNLK